jgi:predicted RNA-binding Zn-ribbon protein involved in translation (DUF1610 family)
MEEQNPKVKFICPKDGEVSQDDVVFLCNVCEASEVKVVDGVYLCKQCEASANPLECRLCGSKEVRMYAPHIDLPINAS